MEFYLQGFLMCFGLIATIGAQNTFLLKQGLLKQHVFLLCVLFFLCDCLLFSLGVFGLGHFISQEKIASVVLALVGGLFLLVYGARAFLSAYRNNTALALEQSTTLPLKKIILIALALTFLNPHVYLDTIVIVGGIAGTLSAEQKFAFLLGTISASGLWFFSVGYGARLLIPFFRNPITWRLLDSVTGIIMWFIAFNLLRYALLS
ncbi:LysE/ArgO family amino acid transporter [Avibacterium avium]|uniref:LysE/ArgO family amino acid transporter n=1 Tax=Avibacterium avium TaxID=751 RepID=UPI003BF84EA9